MREHQTGFGRLRLTGMAVFLGFCVGGVSVPDGRADSPSREVLGEGISIDRLDATPKISFAETTYEFGEVEAGEMVHHEFVFTNEGDARLKVRDVSPGCGCTVMEDWDREVAPGESGSLAVNLDTTNLSGSIQKAIRVESNASDHPQMTLRMAGSVWRPIEVRPKTVQIRVQKDRTDPATRTVRVLNNMGEPLELSTPEVKGNLFEASLRPVKEGWSYEIEIQAGPPFGCYSQEDRVVVETSSESMPRLEVKVAMIPEDALQLLPRTIGWPTQSDAKHTSVVTLMNRGEEPVTLSNPSTDISGVEVRMKELQQGKLFRLFVEFAPGFQIPEEGRGEVSVEVDGLECPTVRIPVIGDRT